MKSEELQMDILKKQNREMAIKMQIYRVQNQELRAKNQELNQWVGNLSEVFSTISASWESITILEQTLQNLMRKKTDARDRTLLRKYQFHFKTFADIINNLSEKIKNKGHSDQATQNAKEQLRCFVKNYELIFKEMLESYFKFNQQYSQYLNGLQNREDVKQQFRSIALKSVQNSQKIKEFQTYMQELKQNLTKFEQYNNKKLLEGVVQKKQQQIQGLRERNNILQRRIKAMFDYNSASIDLQINSKDEDYECKCGGVQLTYMKKSWQQKIKNQGQRNTVQQVEEAKSGIRNQASQAFQLSIFEQQKQDLIKRNALLSQKISKMSSQYKLTEQMVLKSNVYQVLKQQCQSLLDYISQLLIKIKKQQDYLNMIQRARDQELKEVKRKFEKSKGNQDKINGSGNFVNPIDLFKTEVTNLIREYTLAFQDLSKKHAKSQEVLKGFKEKIDQIKKANEELNKKVNDLQAKQLSRADSLQFRYEKFKEIESSIHTMLQKQQPKLLPLWQDFITYVKTRDKKITTLESLGRKKDKQLAQKAEIEQLMKADSNQIQRVYKENKEKLNKTQQFIKKVEVELLRLAAQNIKIQNEFEEQKSLLNMRVKAETEARNRLEQKMLMTSKIEQQYIQIRDNEARIQKDYQSWIQQTKKTLQQNSQSLAQKQLLIKSVTEQNKEKQRQLQKIQTQRETLKSQTRQLKNRLDNLNSSAQNELLRMQLQEYKGKIMCSCAGDRERQVVLKTCPHLFCKRCIQDTTQNRNRKCPLCGIRFTKTDVHQIKWN